jgi:hypothetical protein
MPADRIDSTRDYTPEEALRIEDLAARIDLGEKIDDLKDELDGRLEPIEHSLKGLEGGIRDLVRFAQRDDDRKEEALRLAKEAAERSAEDKRLRREADLSERKENRVWMRGWFDKNGTTLVISALTFLGGAFSNKIREWLGL